MTDIEQEAAEVRKRLQFSRATRPGPATIWEKHQYPTYHKTVVVLGVMHSGTSAVAAVLHGLGVDFNPAPTNNFEEQRIKDALRHQNEHGHDDAMPSVIHDRHLQANVWGFKLPDVFDHRTPRELHSFLRQPYYIFVLRDLAAISQPNATSSFNPHGFRHLLESHNETSKLLDAVQRLPPAPKMLVSYQRLLQYPQRFCEQTIEFLGIQSTHTQKLRALSSISPTGGYLMTHPDSFGWKYERIG